MEEEVQISGAGEFECPHCGQGVEVSPGEEGEVVLCPHCGGEFEIPAADEPEPDRDASTDASSKFEELDGVRIRHLSVGRRAAARGRSYAILGFLLCAFAVVRVIVLTVTTVRLEGWGMRPVGYVFFAMAAAMAMAFCGRRVVWMHREMKTPVLTDPEGKPDFTGLSDGSQQWKNLEKM